MTTLSNYTQKIGRFFHRLVYNRRNKRPESQVQRLTQDIDREVEYYVEQKIRMLGLRKHDHVMDAFEVFRQLLHKVAILSAYPELETDPTKCVEEILKLFILNVRPQLGINTNKVLGHMEDLADEIAKTIFQHRDRPITTEVAQQKERYYATRIGSTELLQLYGNSQRTVLPTSPHVGVAFDLNNPEAMYNPPSPQPTQTPQPAVQFGGVFKPNTQTSSPDTNETTEPIPDDFWETLDNSEGSEGEEEEEEEEEAEAEEENTELDFATETSTDQTEEPSPNEDSDLEVDLD